MPRRTSNKTGPRTPLPKPKVNTGPPPPGGRAAGRASYAAAKASPAPQPFHKRDTGFSARSRGREERGPAENAPRFPPPITDFPWFVTVVPGLERIAEEEIRSLDKRAKAGPSMPGLVTFDAEVYPEQLLELRCVEDVFATLTVVQPVVEDETGPLQVFRATQRSPLWDDALEAHRSLRPQKRKRSTYRVVAQLAGEHAFRRIDLRRAVEDAVVHHSNGLWERVEENATLEVWVRGDRERVVTGVRLSDNTMRHRTYKEIQLPASLKPTVAAAMVRLTRPSPEDTFLDPMCGSGTLLIERALAGRHTLIIGGDNDPNALDAARTNVGRKHQPLCIEPMDVRLLPLDIASIDKLATNLPFGRQIGDPLSLPDLYEAALHEFARVVKPGGRAVLLADRQGEWKEILSRMKQWDMRQQIRVELLGQRPTILVLNRTDVEPEARGRKRK